MMPPTKTEERENRELDPETVKLIEGMTRRGFKEAFIELGDGWREMTEGDEAMACNSSHQQERNMARARHDTLNRCATEVDELLVKLMKEKK